ncbi:alpha/beta hydrolase fold domain-containing protein [Streptomyces sp. 5-6(2022)]|uniref:alpha/beta hydrolase n=1 Tax=Streptomyces sp. 5-6(2022) TaxID=2936510 RepID=UPI0031BAFB83
MIIGDHRTGVAGVLDWAVDTGAVVVSVNYRLAPEHPDPGPVGDCYPGLLWIHEHAAEIGGDPERIVVAGAHRRRRGERRRRARGRRGPAGARPWRPWLLGQVLMCPCSTTASSLPAAGNSRARGSGTPPATRPDRVLSRQALDERRNLFCQRWPTRSDRCLTPLPAHQTAVPGQQRPRGDQPMTA